MRESEIQVVNDSFDLTLRRVEEVEASHLFLAALGSRGEEKVEVAVGVGEHGYLNLKPVNAEVFAEVLSERFADRVRRSFPAQGMTIQEAVEHMHGRLDRDATQQIWFLDNGLMLDYTPGFDERTGKNNGALWFVGRDSVSGQLD